LAAGCRASRRRGDAIQCIRLLSRFAIKLIARRHGVLVKTPQDYELTDYAALEAFIDRFAASAIATDGPPMPIWSGSRSRR